ncbi:MAG: dethiobiotin synthase [Nitrospiraceae bacterium]|nr:MAG: dethiobiotin synthase [Nitrospiraceae bacterium]
MNKGFFITGTDTGVGKTFVATGLIKALKTRGLVVCPMKPAETGCRVRQGQLFPQDTITLIKASGVDEPIDAINPYRMKNPLAPAVAAEKEGIIVKKKVILNAYKKLSHNYELIIAEGAGGIMVPLYKRYLFLDLVSDLDIPLLIIAHPGLGTINHSLLTLNAARKRGIRIMGLIFNHVKKTITDISIKSNPEVIARIGKVPVIGIVPHISRHNKKTEEIFDVIATKVAGRLG